STRWGCNANARQIRLTAVWLNPQRRAMARVLQCVASRGVFSSVSRTTCSTCSSVIFRGAPGRGSSSSPATRFATNRRRQRPTVWRVTRASTATALLSRPLTHASTMRARCASACAVVGRRAQRSSVARSSSVSVTRTFGRPRRIGVLLVYTENVSLRHLVSRSPTQDTRRPLPPLLPPAQRGQPRASRDFLPEQSVGPEGALRQNVAIRVRSGQVDRNYARSRMVEGKGFVYLRALS